MDSDFWNKWILDKHSFVTIQRWVTQLNKFRFCKGYGGHGADEDAFRMAIPGEDINELNSHLAVLGICARRLDANDEIMREDVRYKPEDARHCVRPIREFPEYVQIGRCKIADRSAFVWITQDRATISLSNEKWTVGEQEFEDAKVIEAHIHELNVPFMDPPEDTERCVCPSRFPQFWI